MEYHKLSILIPAYNEKETIQELIRRVQAADIGSIEKEIMVIDDGSTDGTREILGSIPGIRYIFHEKNLGKGGALKTGIHAATGDLVIFQDADLEYDPNDYAAMIAPILAGTATWTNGVRAISGHDPRRGTMLGVLHRIGNRTITGLTNVLYWHTAGEYEGCYKVFPKALLETLSIQTNDFDFDNEVVCRLLKRSIFPADVHISYAPRGYEQGKHITWRHGVKILGTIVRIRFE
jgi:glycosyltransferase involved in cell wall biosynthesis